MIKGIVTGIVLAVLLLGAPKVVHTATQWWFVAIVAIAVILKFGFGVY